MAGLATGALGFLFGQVRPKDYAIDRGPPSWGRHHVSGLTADLDVRGEIIGAIRGQKRRERNDEPCGRGRIRGDRRRIAQAERIEARGVQVEAVEPDWDVERVGSRTECAPHERIRVMLRGASRPSAKIQRLGGVYPQLVLVGNSDRSVSRRV